MLELAKVVFLRLINDHLHVLISGGVHQDSGDGERQLGGWKAIVRNLYGPRRSLTGE